MNIAVFARPLLDIDVRQSEQFIPFVPSVAPMSQGTDGLGPNTELLTFNGSDASDVTALLQNVKRVAFSQGRRHDDQWLMDYAEISLTGAALRWFHELDDQTLDSW